MRIMPGNEFNLICLFYVIVYVIVTAVELKMGVYM